MPTKKRRVGFIPRIDVLDLINKLSFENNLSISKITNILVEEALYKRGLFNSKTGKAYSLKDNNNNNSENVKRIKLKNDCNDLSNEFNNKYINIKNQNIMDASKDLIDNEIYDKFLMFLQFQERIKSKIIE